MPGQKKHRNPVPGTVMKRPLPCIDLDPADLNPDRLVGTVCRNQYLALAQGVKFKCPNKSGNNGCEAGAFLYPRKRNSLYFHFHQGIDLGHLDHEALGSDQRADASGLPILSVTEGRVTHVEEWDEKSSGYGTAVGIYHYGSQRLFWYAHCLAGSITVSRGQPVSEGQIIARVGNTGKAGAPHLHFEVIASRLIKGEPEYERVAGGAEWERGLGNPVKPRLDPLKVLQELGPWASKQVFVPLGQPFEPELAASLHDDVERGSYGGYFPLGANNFWHGGVHLSLLEGSLVHAACDGTIVAARLAPGAASGTWKSGHTSFILVRHEVPQAVFDRMQHGPSAPKPPAKPAGPKGGKVGFGYKVTDPAAVDRVKARLYELEIYDPVDPDQLRDGKVERELGEAIEVYQLTLDNPYKKKPELWPDGVVEVSGYTWNHLFPPEEASDEPRAPNGPASDPSRTIYCLYMHLQPLTPREALAADVNWVTRVKMSTEAGETEQAPVEDPVDREEADAHRIKADVYLGSSNTADIEWVERRLITLGLLTARSEATGLADADLDAAILAFQAKYPWPGKSANWDGVVQKGGKTDKQLRKTAFELAAAAAAPHGGGGGKDPIDPAFVAALAQLDRFGIAEVVSGLDVRVSGGEPLWKSGRAGSYNAGGQPELREELHWEVFSESLLFPSWDTIDDSDDDLHADLPATILEKIDVWPDKILSPLEIFAFYQRDACHDLRRTACRFRSEWGLDIDKTIRRLDELQFNTLGLREALEPYQWWDRVRDVLPAGLTHAWHYNPIELFRIYQEILDEASAPAPGEKPEPRDPALEGELVVRVLAANGMPPSRAVTVALSVEETSYTGADTDDSGTARFHRLPTGTYEVSLLDADAGSKSAEVNGYTTVEVTLETALDGKPVPRGELTVWVRKPTGGAAVGARVTLGGAALDRTVAPLVIGKKSTVTFADLRAGEYSVHVEYPEHPNHPNERVEIDEVVQFDGKKRKARITVPRGWSDVQVLHDDDGVAVTGQVLDEQGKVLTSITTDGSGRASLRVRLGKYKVELGGRTKNIHVDSRRWRSRSRHLEGNIMTTARNIHGSTLQFQLRAGLSLPVRLPAGVLPALRRPRLLPRPTR